MVLQDLSTWMLMVGIIFVCTSYCGASDDICNALASLARHLCTDYVDPAGLTAFTACRLIALDICPHFKNDSARTSETTIVICK